MTKSVCRYQSAYALFVCSIGHKHGSLALGTINKCWLQHELCWNFDPCIYMNVEGQGHLKKNKNLTDYQVI